MLSFVIERYIRDKIRLPNDCYCFCTSITLGIKVLMNTLFCLKDFHPSDIERFASCGMDNTVKIWSMKG
jgi:polycomb protein EED